MKILLRFALLAAVAACAATLGSCNLISPIAYAIDGPGKITAIFVPPDVPTVVYVDDRASVMSRSSLRQLLADQASELLMVNKALTTTISPRDAMALVRQERRQAPMPIDEIGRSVGAQQVIFVEMQSFVLSTDGFTPRPQGLALVRVIDVANRQRLFPDPESNEPSYLLDVSTREVTPEMYQTTSGRRDIEEMLAKEMGVRLAELFYEHERVDLGSNLQTR